MEFKVLFPSLSPSMEIDAVIYFLMVAAFAAKTNLSLLMCKGMATTMLGSTLQTRCMALEFIVLQMGIDMREHGMRVEGKAWGCTHLETERPKQVTGKMVSLIL